MRARYGLLAAISGVARVKAGGARVFCRRPAAQVATLIRSGRRDGPRRYDGDARNSTRRDSRAAPATLRLHLDVSIPRQAQDRYVAKTLSRPRPRQLTTLPGRS